MCSLHVQPGEPDDGGTVCQDNGQQDYMVLVLNEGDDPNTNGFADANSADEYRALLMRTTCLENTMGTQALWEMEFRYDGARQRYYTRFQDMTGAPTAEPTWTAYLGDGATDDYDVYSDQLGQYHWHYQRRFMSGLWETDRDANTTGYLHGDLIGSTVAVTSADATPAVLRRVVYTAFGEAISVAGPDGNPAAAPFATRYGYAGAFGYQEHDVGSCGLIGTNSLPPAEGCTQTTWSPDGLPDSLLNASPLAGFRFQHLGHRHYDPSTGRFFQRDPKGLGGGLNVYEYAHSAPTRLVDPSGLGPIEWVYTGKWNPTPAEYNGAVDAAARALPTWFQGGYISGGRKLGRWGGGEVGIGWTIEDGWFVWGYLCVSLNDNLEAGVAGYTGEEGSGGGLIVIGEADGGHGFGFKELNGHSLNGVGVSGPWGIGGGVYITP